MSEKCSLCRFWNKAVRASWADIGSNGKSYLVEHAQCRRFAPARMSASEKPVPGRAWPHVNANDWCGDYQGQPA